MAPPEPVPSLSPQVFAVRSRDDLIILDVRSDSYALIVDAASDADDAPVLLPTGMPLVGEAVDALAAEGLIEDRASYRVDPLAAPKGSLPPLTRDRRLASPRDVTDLLLAMFGGWRRSRGGMPCRAYRTERRSASADLLAVRDAVGALDAARLIVPTPGRCLPASLITSLFLSRRGVASEIVFGVRTHPFAAHCWVEVAGIPVDDDPERTAAYLPICVADA